MPFLVPKRWCQCKKLNDSQSSNNTTYCTVHQLFTMCEFSDQQSKQSTKFCQRRKSISSKTPLYTYRQCRLQGCCWWSLAQWCQYCHHPDHAVSTELHQEDLCGRGQTPSPNVADWCLLYQTQPPLLSIFSNRPSFLQLLQLGRIPQNRTLGITGASFFSQDGCQSTDLKSN